MPCQTCKKIRSAITAIFTPRRSCVVRGCRGNYPICNRHFMMLPLEMRQRWWRETNYSGQPPGKAMIDAVNARVNPA
jgi:hypothetical protein